MAIRSVIMNPPSNKPLAWDEIVPVAIHDMRSPLSSIRTTLEIVRMLNSQCDRTSGLIDKLDKQVLELAGLLERFQNDPASFRR